MQPEKVNSAVIPTLLPCQEMDLFTPHEDNFVYAFPSYPEPLPSHHLIRGEPCCLALQACCDAYHLGVRKGLG